MRTMDFKFYTNQVGMALMLTQENLNDLGIYHYQILEKRYQDLDNGKGYLIRVTFEEEKSILEKMRFIRNQLASYEEKRNELFDLESSGKNVIYEEEVLLEEKIELLKETCPHSVVVSLDEYENVCLCCHETCLDTEYVIHLENLYFPMTISNDDKISFAQEMFFQVYEENPNLTISQIVELVQQRLECYAQSDVLVCRFRK